MKKQYSGPSEKEIHKKYMRLESDYYAAQCNYSGWCGLDYSGSVISPRHMRIDRHSRGSK